MDNLTKILLTKYQPDSPLLQEPPQAHIEVVSKEALPVDEEASEEAVEAFKAAVELLEKKASAKRARELVETIKRAKEGK